MDFYEFGLPVFFKFSDEVFGRAEGVSVYGEFDFGGVDEDWVNGDF